MVSSRKIITVLNKTGWFEVNQLGSHKQFKNKSKKGRVTLPHPKKDIGIETFKSILKQMGITNEEFKRF